MTTDDPAAPGRAAFEQAALTLTMARLQLKQPSPPTLERLVEAQTLIARAQAELAQAAIDLAFPPMFVLTEQAIEALTEDDRAALFGGVPTAAVTPFPYLKTRVEPIPPAWPGLGPCPGCSADAGDPCVAGCATLAARQAALEDEGGAA